MAIFLYLEDEAWQVDGTVLKVILREYGHQFELVLSLEEARSRLQSHRYDGVWLDVGLNLEHGQIEFERSGLALMKQILDGEFEAAGNSSQMLVVVASGVWDTTVKGGDHSGATVETIVSALGVPPQFYLRKPFLVDELFEVVNSALPRIPRPGDR